MSGDSTTRVLVLGPCRVRVEGRDVPVTAVQRRLLSRLAVTPQHSVPLSDLFESLWDSRPPATARTAVHNQVSRLRAAAGPGIVATTTDGYLLLAETDLAELRTAVHVAERMVATEPEEALDLVTRALTLAVGDPFADLAGDPGVEGARVEALALVAAARDLEVEAALGLRLPARALAAAQRLRAEAPYDERRAARLVRALDLAGRRGEALEEAARFRRVMRTELGLECDGALNEVEAELFGAGTEPVRRAPDLPGLDQGVARLLDRVAQGRSVAVRGGPASGVSTVLRAVRNRLAGEGAAVGFTRVRGYRDVAAAPLLDLLDELGVVPSRSLGPVGSFLPALAEQAADRRVVLIVDDLDLAGPSTRHALLEASALDGICLLAGIHGDDSGQYDGLEELPVPSGPAADDVEGLRARLRAQPEHVRRTLAAVAVAGRDAPVWVMTSLHVRDGLDEALEQQLVEQDGIDGPVRFREPLMRELALAETPSGLRQEMHHALGRALLAAGAPAEAARHLLSAPGIEPGATVAAARAAAAAASSSGAHLDAVDWLRRALAETAGLAEARDVLAVRIELGDAMRLAGDPGHLAALTDAVDEAERLGDPALLGEAMFALLQLGGTTVSTALDPAVEARLGRALSRIEDGELAATVRAAASLAHSMTGNPERCRRLFVDAERAAVSPATRRRVLPFAYMSLGLPSDLPERTRYAEELTVLGATAGDAVAEYEGLHLQVSTRVQAGDGDGARAAHARMQELVDQVGDVGRRWSLLYLEAALAHLDGELAACERLSRTAYGQLLPVSESRATAALFGQLFGLSIVRGDVAALAPFLEGLVADQPGIPAWNAALSLALVDTAPAQALEYAARTLDVVRPDSTWLAAHLVAGRATALAGSAPTSLLDAFTERLAPSSGLITWQGTCSYGPVDTTLALLARARGDRPGARSLARAAHDQATALGAPVFVADLDALGLLPAEPA